MECLIISIEAFFPPADQIPTFTHAFIKEKTDQKHTKHLKTRNRRFLLLF
jgi:hypothetical protein